MIREVRCLVLVCDGCAVASSQPGEGGEIHYEDAAEARADATRDLDWSRCGERDLCPRCTCSHRGHEWQLWVPSVPSPLAPHRWCTRCDITEPIPDQQMQLRDEAADAELGGAS